MTAERGALQIDSRQWPQVARTVIQCIIEARPAVQLIYILRFAGAFTLAGRNAIAVQSIYATFAWWLAIIGIYLLNGIMDIEGDVVNGSGRPIARGDLPVEVARRWVGVLSVAAVIIALCADRVVALLVVVMLVLGYVYSGPPFHAKRHSGGTAVVVLLAGLLTYAAGFQVASGHLPGSGDSALVLLAVMMSAWMAGVGSIAKDLSDIPGDQHAGRRTLALSLGAHRTRAVICVIAPAIGAAFLLLAWRVAPILLPAAAVTLAGAVTLIAFSLTKLGTGDGQRLRRPYRTFMVTQYATHLAVIGAATCNEIA